MSIEIKRVGNYGKNKIPSIEGDDYFLPVIDGEVWNYAAETEDVAMLLALQIKYEGSNSQFCKHACRMLNIDSVWAE